MYFNFNPNLNTCAVREYQDICKNNEVMQFCIEIWEKNQKTPKHITKHANTIKLVPVRNNMQHSVVYAFNFLLQLIIYSILWICWGNFLEYFILHYLVLVHSCTQKTENIVTHSHNEIWPRLRIHVKILWTCSITKLFVSTTLFPLTI